MDIDKQEVNRDHPGEYISDSYVSRRAGNPYIGT